MSSHHLWIRLVLGVLSAPACHSAAGSDDELSPADSGEGGALVVDDGESPPPSAGTSPVFMLGGNETGGTSGSPSIAGGAGGLGGASGAAGGVGAAGGNTAGSAAAGGSASGGAGAGAANGGAGGSSGGGASEPVGHGACLDGIRDFDKPGPFKTTTKRQGAVNFYVPGVPAGCKVPIIHLANGTGASCSTYSASLQRLATHGFLGACYESTNTGAGDQGLKALDTALATFPELVDNKFGSTGHSQGGQAAFTVLALAEKKYGERFTYAGLAIQPASGFGAQPTGTTWQALYGAIRSPLFMWSGLGTDGLVSQAWVQQAYDATSKTVEAYFWTARGANHIPVPNGETQQIAIPWFRWKLLGDQAACRAFAAIPKNDAKWAQVAAKNQQACR
jgi:hypothetical protein